MDWRSAEKDIRELLGLDSTIGSGNKWYDIGDSVDHDPDSSFPLLVETKSTIHKSYSISRKYVQEYWEKASMRGKRFLLHIQFQDREPQENKVEKTQNDWVALPLDDFLDLYELSRREKLVVESSLPERTEEEDVAVQMIELLFQHIGDSETRSKYYDWWALLEKYIPSTEVQK